MILSSNGVESAGQVTVRLSEFENLPLIKHQTGSTALYLLCDPRPPWIYGSTGSTLLVVLSSSTTIPGVVDRTPIITREKP